MTGITLYFTPRILRLLTDYRMWANDRPDGDLAQALAGVPRYQGGDPNYAVFKDVTQAHLDELLAFAERLHRDIRTAGCNQSDSAAAAQWKRRLRELTGSHTTAPAVRPTPAARAMVRRADLAPLFAPPPAQGPARTAYEQRVWAALVDFVDFTQTAAWLEPQA